jgi:hypothetical protein
LLRFNLYFEIDTYEIAFSDFEITFYGVDKERQLAAALCILLGRALYAAASAPPPAPKAAAPPPGLRSEVV